MKTRKNIPPLPWHLGSRKGHNASSIFSHGGKDEHHDPVVLTVPGISLHRTVEEVRADTNGHGSNKAGLAVADFTLMAVNNHDALVEMLRSIKARIEESEHWWMDSPHKGGFDLDGIDSLLSKISKEPIP